MGFAALFYQSGLQVTVLILEPASVSGAADWLWIASFPLLLSLWPAVNRRFGCSGGGCSRSACQGRLEVPPGH